MFQSEEEFKQWAASLRLPEETINLISNIRASEPSRRVQSRKGNVSGRYPSKKMGRTIQFESHRNELARIYEMEHDTDVIEYWDQPPSFILRYTAINGRQLGVIHTPDFFVIRSSSAGWVECKVEGELNQTGGKTAEPLQERC